MAKKATSGTTGAKKSTAKPKASVRRASTSTAVAKRSSSRREGPGSDNSRERREKKSAAEMLLKLLESPLVADLLAVGATAALAALTEHRYSARSEDGSGRGAKRAIKGAVTAAAAAMGRRIATEFDEIKKAAKAKRGEAV